MPVGSAAYGFGYAGLNLNLQAIANCFGIVVYSDAPVPLTEASPTEPGSMHGTMHRNRSCVRVWRRECNWIPTFSAYGNVLERTAARDGMPGAKLRPGSSDLAVSAGRTN